jgi:hypothetical protein
MGPYNDLGLILFRLEERLNPWYTPDNDENKYCRTKLSFLVLCGFKAKNIMYFEAPIKANFS